MQPILLLAVLAVAAPAASAADAGVNPLSQVHALLGSLSAKVVKEGEAEEKAYKEFVQWCSDAAANKKFEIKTATSKKEKLEALIGKSAGDAEASRAKIEDLAASLSTDEAELKSATEVREKENTDFGANEAELMDVVDTLGRAITMLEREMAKHPAAFAQMDISTVDGLLKSLNAVVDAAAFPAADKQKLLSLVQSQQGGGADDGDFGAPAAAAYKQRSASIVDVLEDMKEKAEEQLGNLRKAETNARHNYEMLRQSLEDQTAADTKDMAEEKAAKAGSEEAKATAESDLAATTKDLADAKAALETANGDCMQASADHQATVKARSEELAAIAEAKQILQNSTAGAASQSYSLLQKGRSHSGLQLETRADLANAEVVTLVRQLAKRHHSQALAQLASRIAAVMQFGSATGEEPFAKVKALISELISRLEAEADSEATEKAYCDEQMAKTEQKKGELDYDISKLTAKIDQTVAKSAGLKSEVQELQAELMALAKQTAEMDKIRQEGHAAYAKAKEDLEAGLEGVRRALTVLRSYYGSGAAASAMLQGGSDVDSWMQQPSGPESHAKATGAGSGIIGLLEVVESDFAKSLAREEAQEDDAQAEYEKMTQANKISKTLKEQDVKYLTKEFKGLDKELAEITGDRETTDAELSAVVEYYASIKERCIAKPSTYEERKARREAEIAGLKEALSILEDETAFVQRKKRGQKFLGLPGQ